ncbi:glycerol 3-phosphate dehydrogenase [Campylobacter iguaniorum]|uniref:NAD(P)H-dependent glycerol-3-phosphate dehydrogenase n=1 Tax=Campylobacter iguaniorum TaxID=1244531 RepID=UPI0007C8DB9C|nr:NAD(P)H-dependent glycerol-3-phosphate dehydrogenase [Campylobacter iguaniorum]ANE36073.1 glycerol 3-phosphate dehydrogenase [Campylobacter iguaniorum]
MSIAVIGAGKWGQGLHFAFSQKQTCLITSPHTKDLPNFVSIDEALKCEYLVFALSAQGISAWLKEHFKNKGQKILLASKGIDTASCRFLDEIFLDFVDKSNFCVLSGPSFAAEVMQGLPCALCVSGFERTLCEEFVGFFPDFIKAYAGDDVRGAEICGAYKNVLAIASGICEGLGLGNNARASLIARGLIEMHRFGAKFGAKEETFLGLSGAGDLFLTASSTLSRNFRVGLGLAQQKPLQEVLNSLGEVAEGVPTAYAITNLAKQKSIYAPIATEVCAMLDGKNVQESLKDLLKKK